MNCKDRAKLTKSIASNVTNNIFFKLTMSKFGCCK